MSISIPIVAYALAEGSGHLATTPEGAKNAGNLRAVSEAMSWIDAQAIELLSVCGEEHRCRTSPFDYFDGRRVTFEPRPYEKQNLERLLNFYGGRKLCLLVPSRKALFKMWDDEVLRRVWDRRKYGYQVELLSVECEDYPLRSDVGFLHNKIADYLIGNAMRTESFVENSVKSSISQPKSHWA